VTLHLIDLLVELLLLVALFTSSSILVSDIAHLAAIHEGQSTDLDWLSEDLALFIVVVDEDLVGLDVELSLSDLLRGWLGFIKLKLLGDLLLVIVSIVGLVLDIVVLVCIDHNVWVNSATSINELVFSTCVSLEGLSANLLLSVDETIIDSVMIIPDLSVLVINLAHCLPVVVLVRWVVVFNGLELI
jgi:hypothetical protein